MKPSERERAFFESALAALEENDDHLSPEARARRRRELLAALSVPLPARRPRSRVKGWAIMAIVAASVAITAINLAVTPPAREPVGEALIADVDLLSSADPIELYEDLGFYRWLAEATEDAK